STEDVVDRGLGPAEWVIGAHDDLRGADLRGEMAQRLRREDQRVEVELAQVFGRLLLQLHRRAALGEGEADVVRSIGVGGEVAAAVRGTELDPREAVERAFVNQMRQR